MAWVNKGEILSILKSIGAVSDCGLHLTLCVGGAVFHTQLFRSRAGTQMFLWNSKV